MDVLNFVKINKNYLDRIDVYLYNQLKINNSYIGELTLEGFVRQLRIAYTNFLYNFYIT